MTDRVMSCPVSSCTYEEWVLPNDEDGSFSELWNHVVRRHTGGDGTEASTLMALVEAEER
ncbi:hypothetical protein [Streptomyces sp. NPDC059009]|uniref:hypothetical protein n=1 Tax=Streptomyces sp. NPDC059009 TaxID=3346694 RepID=UPI0036BC88D1